MVPRLLACLVAGLGMAAAFDPWRLVPLLPVGLAVLALAVHGRSVRQAALLGGVLGVGFMFWHLSWMRAVGVDAWLALAAVEASFLVLVGAGFRLVQRLRWWPLWAAAVWVAVEAVRSDFPFGGMPWGRLAYATVDTPWAAGLPWLGATGVSLLIALLGTCLAGAVLSARHAGRSLGSPAVWAPTVGVLVLSAVPAVIGPPSYDADGTLTIAAVQGDVPGDGSDVLLDHRQVTRNHVEATVGLADDVRSGAVPAPDLVLWPENSTAVDPFRDTEVGTGIRTAVAAIGVPVVVGAMVDGPDPDGVLNQGIVWDPRTGAGDRYTKRHPVPFGEYIPYRDKVFTRNFGRLSLIPRDMFSGTRVQPLDVAGARVADAICFDIAYDDGIHAQVGRGAQLLVVQTSNAMFVHTHQLEQQFAITRLRAIETGRSVAVASTNGISGIIAPDGSVRQRADRRTQAVLVEEVPLFAHRTPAVVMGPWVARGVLAVALLAVVLTLVPYRRREEQGGRDSA